MLKNEEEQDEKGNFLSTLSTNIDFTSEESLILADLKNISMAR